jgi:tRNA (guanine-N1)-methyltransferase
MFKIDVVTIFPQLFDHILEYGVLKESRAQKLCEFNTYDLRDFTKDKHKKVDDRPFGGGPGITEISFPLIVIFICSIIIFLYTFAIAFSRQTSKHLPHLLHRS